MIVLLFGGIAIISHAAGAVLAANLVGACLLLPLAALTTSAVRTAPIDHPGQPYHPELTESLAEPSLGTSDATDTRQASTLESWDNFAAAGTSGP